MTSTGRRRMDPTRIGFTLAVNVAVLVGGPGLLHGQRPSGPTAAPAGRIIGLVVDGESRRGIEGVLVSLGADSVVTNERGRFVISDLKAGPAELVSEILGYETRQDSLSLPEYQATEVVIHLARDPVDLVPIRVVLRSRQLEQSGFFERRESGYAGHFFTRVDLEERGSRNVTGLLRHLPGVRLLNSGIEGDRVVFERAISLTGGGMCEPALFLDGVKSQIRLYDMILDPSHVEGVEVYTGATIPGRYNDPCGAVLVWTRIP